MVSVRDTFFFTIFAFAYRSLIVCSDFAHHTFIVHSFELLSPLCLCSPLIKRSPCAQNAFCQLQEIPFCFKYNIILSVSLKNVIKYIILPHSFFVFCYIYAVVFWKVRFHLNHYFVNKRHFILKHLCKCLSWKKIILLTYQNPNTY